MVGRADDRLGGLLTAEYEDPPATTETYRILLIYSNLDVIYESPFTAPHSNRRLDTLDALQRSNRLIIV